MINGFSCTHPLFSLFEIKSFIQVEKHKHAGVSYICSFCLRAILTMCFVCHFVDPLKLDQSELNQVKIVSVWTVQLQHQKKMLRITTEYFMSKMLNREYILTD